MIINLNTCRAISDFQAKQNEVGRSGRTGPPLTDEERIVSDILALDNSLRLNANVRRNINNNNNNVQPTSSQQLFRLDFQLRDHHY